MPFEVLDLGLIDFRAAQHKQKEIFAAVKSGRLFSALILCQHYPVISLARRAKSANILLAEEELAARGIEICAAERGGDVTYHGPGQIMAYPVFDLKHFKKDIHYFLRKLEDAVINLLADFDIQAGRFPGLTGVWVGRQKISSVGIAIRNWITFQGLALNVKSDDLDNFRFIRPCGMDIEVTCMEQVKGIKINVAKVKENLITQFKNIFN